MPLHSQGLQSIIKGRFGNRSVEMDKHSSLVNRKQKKERRIERKRELE